MSAEVLAPELSAAELATLANREHSEVERSLGDALGHAWRSGDALRRAKLTVSHGRWAGWLADNFAGSARTAQLYCQLRAAYPQRVTDLPAGVGIRRALRLASAENGGRTMERVNAQPKLRPEPDTLAAALDALSEAVAVARYMADHADAIERAESVAPLVSVHRQVAELLDDARQGRQRAQLCECGAQAMPNGEDGCSRCGHNLPALALVAGLAS